MPSFTLGRACQGNGNYFDFVESVTFSGSCTLVREPWFEVGRLAARVSSRLYVQQVLCQLLVLPTSRESCRFWFKVLANRQVVLHCLVDELTRSRVARCGDKYRGCNPRDLQRIGTAAAALRGRKFDSFSRRKRVFWRRAVKKRN